jgi:hypothetical protein
MAGEWPARGVLAALDHHHMIEEYALHSGHADLIRELVAPPAGGR